MTFADFEKEILDRNRQKRLEQMRKNQKIYISREEAKVKKRARERAYRKTEKYRAWRREYRKKKSNLEYQMRYQRKYRKFVKKAIDFYRENKI